MDTFSHGFWTYFIFRKFKGKVVYIVLGSIFPDMIFFINFAFLYISDIWFRRDYLMKLLYEWYSFGVLSREKIAQFFLITTDNPYIIKVIKLFTHSIIIWSMIFILFYLFFRHYTFLKFFLLGWFIHIFEDLFTHVEDASPIFWPLNSRLYKGVISYWDPKYFGKVFNYVNRIFILMAFMYLIFLKYKKYTIFKKNNKKKKERKGPL